MKRPLILSALLICCFSLNTQAQFGGFLKDVGKKVLKKEAERQVVKAVTGELAPPEEAFESVSLINPDAVAIPTISDKDMDSRQGRRAEKLLEKSDKILIPAFRVVFNTQASASASTDSRLINLGSSSKTSDTSMTMKVNLGGVTESALQKIADEAYADFLAGLKASGKEPIPYDEFKNHESYKEIDFAEASAGKAFFKDMKMGDPRAFFVQSPKALPLFFLNSDQFGDQGIFGLGNWKKLTALSHDLDAVIVIPTISIDFVQMHGSGKRSLFKKSSSVKMQQEVSLIPQLSNLYVLHAKPKVAGDFQQYPLDEEIVIPGGYGKATLIKERDNTALVYALSAATGTAGSVSKRSEYMIDANPEAYAALALAGCKALNGKYTEFLKK